MLKTQFNLVSFNICFDFNCRLVGDNIDFEVHARIQSEDNRNRSIHWTQQYAILNKISECLPTVTPQQSLKDFSLSSVLPGPDVLENLTKRWAVLVSRVLCKYLPKFQHLQKSVVFHIPHKYSSEMNQKSNVVSIINNISFKFDCLRPMELLRFRIPSTVCMCFNCTT